MTVTAPALYWYQLDVGTLAPNYYSQLNLAVAQLCAVNSVTAPTAPWYNPVSGTIVNDWHLQIDTAVRALSTALSVTPPSGSVINLTPGTETANYYASLDACVRLLCAASASGTAPTITSDGGGPTATINVTTGDTAVTTVTATGTATISYSISGGADASLFTIDSSTGALTFRAASVDGSYAVTVTATNLFGSANQVLTVSASSAYHADAVHFDGSTWLTCASGSATNNTYFSMSFWAKVNFGANANQRIFLVDASGNYTPEINFLDNGTNHQEASYNIYTTDYLQGFQFGNQFAQFDGAWHHFLASGDLTAQTAQVYMDDIPQSQFDPGFLNTQGTTPGGTLSVNGLEWIFGGDAFIGDNLDNCDIADVWIGLGVNLLDSPTTIPEATRRLFISATGKPVNPSGWPTSAVQFYGNASAFPTNQGTGGAFTLTGSLTNAATSPSD